MRLLGQVSGCQLWYHWPGCGIRAVGGRASESPVVDSTGGGACAESDSAGPEKGLFRSGWSATSTGQSDELLGSGTVVIVEGALALHQNSWACIQVLISSHQLCHLGRASASSLHFSHPEGTGDRVPALRGRWL